MTKSVLSHEVRYIIVALSFGLLATSQSASAAERLKVADVAGEWTRCVAWSGGITFNIVNGQSNQSTCFALGRKCTGNPNATVTYHSSPVIVNAPYQRPCKLKERKRPAKYVVGRLSPFMSLCLDRTSAGC
jgi:hypothetical protein